MSNSLFSGPNKWVKIGAAIGIVWAIAAFTFFLFSPLLIIWSMNSLFPVLAIPYNFQTYIATVILSSPAYVLMFGGNSE